MNAPRHRRTRRAFAALALAAAWLGCLATTAAAGPTNTVPAARLWWFDGIASWKRAEADGGKAVEFASDPIQPPFRWSEAVPSWNAPADVALEIALRFDAAPNEYVLGRWSADTNAAPRTSVRGQRDAWARVDTDTLVAHVPAGEVRILVRARAVGGGAVDPKRLRVGLSLVAWDAVVPEPVPARGAWGRRLEVPVLSQADYPEGVQSWCSPTSLSMLMGWWRGHGVPGLAAPDVRATARAVDDPGWPGTGNWPFNAAHAGSQPGLAACVARLAGIADIEAWILAGRPVAASVSYMMLHGADFPGPGDGHLVVVTGFTETGDVCINDPGVRASRGRQVIRRGIFDRAWAHSRRTVYLLWPADGPRTPGGDGRW